MFSFFKNGFTQNSTALVFLYLSAFRVHYTCIQGDMSVVVKNFDVFTRPGKGKSFFVFCFILHKLCEEKSSWYDKFGNTFPLFWSDHCCLLSHSWFYLFPISQKMASLSRLVNTNCQLTHFTVDRSVWLRSLHESQGDRVAPRVTFGSSPDTWEPLMASPFNLDLDTTMKRVAEHHVLN